MRCNPHLSRALSFALILSLAQLSTAQPETQTPLTANSDCHNACTALVNDLGESAFYEPSSSLPGFRDSFYSTQQRDVVPACIVTPTSPDEVSKSIGVIRQHNCIFAVKSGGHAMFVGASNAPGGITIDLSKLNDIHVSDDLEWARVGTGNRWKAVYSKLEPLNRTVAGGRLGDVGVGGFILGGGISFVSRRYGWALDNVRNFQVVLANGSLTNVNQKSSPDLYWALRGGGNNFGIVTNFDLDIHPQGDVWGGQNFWLMDTSMIADRRARLNIAFTQPSISLTYLKHMLFSGITRLACKLGYCITSKQAFRAFRNVVLAEQNDVHGQMWMSLSYANQIDSFVLGAAIIYSKPEAWPPIFSDYKALKSVYSTGKIQKFTSVYDEVSSFNEIGYRQMWATITFKMSEELLEKILDVFIVEVESVKDVKDGIPALLVQPINKDEIVIFSRNGGNCLGLDGEEGPLIMFSISFRWSKVEDDERMNSMGNTIINRATEMAHELGVYHRYTYQNYANASQDVFAGYGEKNRMKLKEIQRKYDPEGVFRRLQPGYFKV